MEVLKKTTLANGSERLKNPQLFHINLNQPVDEEMKPFKKRSRFLKSKPSGGSSGGYAVEGGGNGGGDKDDEQPALRRRIKSGGSEPSLPQPNHKFGLFGVDVSCKQEEYHCAKYGGGIGGYGGCSRPMKQSKFGFRLFGVSILTRESTSAHGGERCSSHSGGADDEDEPTTQLPNYGLRFFGCDI